MRRDGQVFTCRSKFGTELVGNGIEQQIKHIDMEKTATNPFNGYLVPAKRTALDGRTWWCVYDIRSKEFSHIVFFGKYSTRRGCEFAIERVWETYYEGKDCRF